MKEGRGGARREAQGERRRGGREGEKGSSGRECVREEESQRNRGRARGWAQGVREGGTGGRAREGEL